MMDSYDRERRTKFRRLRWRVVGRGTGMIRRIFEARIQHRQCSVREYRDTAHADWSVGDEASGVVRVEDAVGQAMRLAEAAAVALAGGDMYIDRSISEILDPLREETA